MEKTAALPVAVVTVVEATCVDFHRSPGLHSQDTAQHSSELLLHSGEDHTYGHSHYKKYKPVRVVP